MLNDLNKESNNIGLRINMKKTKVMFNSYTKVKQIKANDDIIETTDRYVYLRQLVKTDYNRLEEVKRRPQTGRSAFSKLDDIMKSNMSIYVKRRVFDHCILPSWCRDLGSENKNGTKT